MRFQFRPRRKPAANHVADFEIVFEEGFLCGLKLVGGALWRSRSAKGQGEGPVYVTLPAQRRANRDGEERYFDLLRSASRDRTIVRDFRERVVCAFQAQEHGRPLEHSATVTK